MAPQPVELNLTIRPQRRFAIIDIAELIREQVGDELRPFRKAAYCSLHTTAGYIEQGMCARLGHSRKQIDPFIRAIKKIFPYNAGYFHDRMQLRDELSEGEKEKEPVNADSHLTFIAAGLKNCVTYIHRPEQPVYFIELDGIYKHYVRSRHTAVMAYNRAEIVHRGRLEIPVGGSHAIDAFNLKDPRYGLFATLADWLRQSGVDKGCIDIRLAPEEKHVGMTVNEYEDLVDAQRLAPGPQRSAALRTPARQAAFAASRLHPRQDARLRGLRLPALLQRIARPSFRWGGRSSTASFRCYQRRPSASCA